MRYVLTGGGSGGHIFPLLSIAKIIKKLDSDAEFLFIGNKDKMEAEIVPKAGIRFESVLSTGTRGKITFQNVKALCYLGVGFFQARRLLRSFRPDFCIGAGGYVSGPVLLAALQDKRIVTALFESDQHMGRANLQFAQKVDLIFSGMFDLQKKYFPNQTNYHRVGHPRSNEIVVDLGKLPVISQKETVQQVLFVGGSLGAECLNQQALLLAKSIPTLQVTVVTGKRYYEQVQREAIELANLHCIAFTNEMSQLMMHADFVVARSSAGVIAELATNGKATLFVPSPNVMNNHQYYNAKYLVDHQAALMVEEKDLTDSSIATYIQAIETGKIALTQLRQTIQQLALNDSVEQIYKYLQKCKQSKEV